MSDCIDPGWILEAWGHLPPAQSSHSRAGQESRASSPQLGAEAAAKNPSAKLPVHQSLGLACCEALGFGEVPGQLLRLVLDIWPPIARTWRPRTPRPTHPS